MKKRTSYFLIIFCCLFITCTTYARSPLSKPLNYCNVARDKHNIPVTGKTIGVQLIILKSSPSGPIVYQEKHHTPTNFFGTFMVTIGSGTPQSGSFDNIKWGDDTYYLIERLDVSGGDVFSVISPPQILHVPFALYAKAGVITPGSDRRIGFHHYTGERFGGGVVFDTWKDADGREHGYIVSLNDQSDSIPWSSIETTAIGPSAQNVWNGKANSAAIIAQARQSKSAARLCRNFSGGGFHDWYLPSMEELNLLYDNRDEIKNVLAKDGHPIGVFIYWTSTELSADNSIVFANFGFPSNNFVYSKYSALAVRAIRAF